jgi:hypothetical protein
MKKILLLCAFFAFTTFAMAQDIITGWTFPVNTGTDSLNANLGTATNKGYDLRFQLYLSPTSDSTINTIYFDNGPTTFAAATAGWQNGSELKFWSVKFKANNYSNFKVSSKQKSVDGPRDFKLQWRLSSGSFEDISDGEVILANDWTTGVVNQLPVPITGQGTGSIYIRWLMKSNDNVNGGTVTPSGVSMIDDILVTAVSSLGVDEVVFTNRITLFPSPNQGDFTVKSTQPVAFMIITDMNGKVIYSDSKPEMESKINLNGAAKGTYLLKVRFADNDKNYTQKFIIR